MRETGAKMKIARCGGCVSQAPRERQMDLVHMQLYLGTSQGFGMRCAKAHVKAASLWGRGGGGEHMTRAISPAVHFSPLTSISLYPKGTYPINSGSTHKVPCIGSLPRSYPRISNQTPASLQRLFMLENSARAITSQYLPAQLQWLAETCQCAL